MRLPRPRITVRHLMLLAAVVAAVFGGWREVGRLRRLAAEHRTEASIFRSREARARADAAQPHADWLASVRDMERINRDGGMWDGGRPEILFASPPPAAQRKLADYYGRMRAKYERAARYPWLSVPPDPPEPRWSP